MEPIVAERYEVLRPLGVGAMGRVDLVRDRTTGEELALKMIGGVTAADDKAILQFRQEFRLMAHLRHPNCCEVFDFGVDAAGLPYFTMEVVPGAGLDEVLPLDEAAFLAVFGQLLAALAYIHRQGFVYLDLKGANVRRRPDAVVKLMDFGLMELAGQGGMPIRGTLPYLSPEVIRRVPFDGRADLYSAGCLAYELLTGQPPFVRATAGEVLRAHLNDAPPPIAGRLPGLSPQVAQVVTRLLAKEPADRFPSAAATMAALGLEPPAGLGGTLFAPPLVGREAPLDALLGRLEGLRRGERADVWLAGEAGVGKSRLLDELRCAAQLADVAWIRVASHEVGQAPYASLAALLRALLPLARTHAPDALGRLAPVLVPVLPDLGVPAAAPTDSQRSDAIRLHAAASDLMAEVARKQPYVLVLEDWRGLDDRSRECLDHHLRNAGAAPRLLLATTRRGPEAPGGPAGLEAVPLAPFDDAAVARMIGEMLGTPTVPPAFAGQVRALTGGVPRDVERLLDHLVKEGQLARRGVGWDLDVAIDEAKLPAAGFSPWPRWWPTAPAELRAIAGSMAIWSRPVDLVELKAATGLDDERLVEGVDQLLRARLVRRDEGDRYALPGRDDVDAVRSVLGPDEARARRGRIATHLAAALAGHATGAAAPTGLVTDYARHALGSSVDADALPWLLEAAERSLALFALADAEEFAVGAASAFANAPGQPPARLRFQVERILAEAKRFGGREAAAEGHYVRAIALAEELGERALAAGLLVSLAKTQQVQQRFDEALAACARALAAAGQAGDDAVASRARVTEGRIRYFQGDLAGARAAAEDAVALAKRGGDAVATSQALSFGGYLVLVTDPSRAEASLALLHEARDLIAAIGDRPGLLNVNNLIGNAEALLGRFVAAGAAFEACRAICRECALPRDEALAAVNMAINAQAAGQLARAAELAEDGLRVARAVDARFPLAAAEGARFTARLRLGAPDAVRGARAVSDLAAAAGNRYLETLLRPQAAEGFLLIGALDDAEAEIGALRALVAGGDDHEATARAEALAAALAIHRGDPAGAEAALARADALVAHMPPLRLRVASLRARAAIAAQRWDAARSLAREALATSRRLGSDGATAELLGLLGEATMRGSADPAAPTFEEMRALADGMADAWLRAEARFGLAAALPHDPAARGRAAEARAILEGLAEALEEPARARFRAHGPWARVLAGDYQAFGKPAVAAPRPGSGPLGLGMGGLGGMGL